MTKGIERDDADAVASSAKRVSEFSPSSSDRR